MNKTYRTVWCESTGTFVAVAENVKARGKRSTGARLLARGTLAVVMTAGAMGAAQADVTIGDSANPATWDGNEITFSDGTGRIVFSNGGIVTGLNDAALAAGSTDAVAGRQLFQTNERVGAAETAITAAQNNITTLQGDVSTAQNNITTLQGDVGTAQTDITALQGQVGNLGTSITTGSVTTDSLNVANGVLAVDSNGVTVGADVDMGGNKITNLGEGVIAAGSTDAVTGAQINSLLIDEGATGIRYFHANSTAADSAAIGEESVAIGPRTTAEGVSSLAAGDGAVTTETAEGSIALGQGATAGPAVAATDDAGAGAIAIGRQSAAGANGAVALGDAATAVAANASALGAGASAAGTRSIAVGTATAMGSGSIAAGNGATSATNDSIALGTAAGQGTGTEVNDPGQRHSFIAIGKNAGQNMDGNEAIAIGVSAGSNTTNSQQIAIGTEAGTYLNGERNVSLGYQANNYGGEQNVRHATAIGGLSKAATDGVGVGYAAEAASGAVAVGAGAIADANSVALGQNSYATNVTGASYLTGLAYNGPSVSVGNTDTGLTRRITNVADGSADNDAVNVNQLRELKDSLGSFDPASGGNVNYNSDGTISVTAGTANNSAVNVEQMNTAIAQGKPQYYSINPNGDTNNIDGSGALGADSANSMAIGHAARINSAEKATAVGYSVLVKADNGTALGSGSTVDDTSGVAIGNAAYSRGENSLAMGTDAQTEQQAVGRTSDNAIAIGTSSRATEDSASALGHHATASGLRSSAVGYMADARGVNAMAFGTESDALATDSQASGTNATAAGVSAQASGTRALASGANAIASGTDSVGYAGNGIAMGTGAVSGFNAVTPEEVARNQNSIAIGTSALANNLNAMAVGNEANAAGESAAAFGDGATASGLRSTAVGRGSNAMANSGIAVGDSASVVSGATNAVALGANATASQQGAVALGSGAVTAAAVGTSSVTVDKKTYGFAGTNPVATVSVGSQGAERTLTNVAAGRVSETSTDAINGSQLYGTNMAVNALGNDLDTAGQSMADVLGGNASYDPVTHQVTINDVGGTGKNTVDEAIEYAAQGWDVSANAAATGDVGANVAPGGSVDFANTDGNIDITRTGTDLAFNLAENIDLGAAGSVTTGDTVMNNDGLTVNDGAGNSTVVGAGDIAVTDPRGTTTISGNEVVVGGTNSIVINGDAGTIGGLTNKTFDPDNFTSGQAATEDQLKSVSDVANAGWNVTDAAGNSANIGPDGKVTFEGDSNISVAQTGVDQEGVIAVSLNENIDLGAAGSVTTGDTVMNNDGLTVNDGAGNSTVVGAGDIAVTDPRGTTTISGNEVVVGGTNSIVINGDAGTIGGLTNKTFDPDNFTSGQAATEDQLKSVSDVANAGWNVTDAAGNSANIGPDGKVTFDGDSNISVAQTGVDQEGVIAVSLNENIDLGAAGSVTTGDTLMNNDGLTVNDGAGNVTSTTATGTRVVDGAGNSAATTAAGTVVSNAAGDTTTLGAGVISVADAAGTTRIGGDQIVVGGASPITLNGAAGTIEGLTNKDVEYPEFADGSGRAATEEQLKQVNDVANAGWNVTDAAGNSANIGPNGVVKFEGDDNISVAQVGEDQNGVIAVSLNENIDLGATGSVTTGNTVMNNDGLTVNDGAGNVTTTTATGTRVVDGAGNSAATTAAGTVVSNAAGDTTTLGAGVISVADAAGTTTIGGDQIVVGGASPITLNGAAGTIEGLTNKDVEYPEFADGSGRAATEEQLKQVNDVANAGWNVTDAAGNSANIGPKGVVTFEGDDNISVAQTGVDQNGVIAVSLNENIDLGATGSVTTGNTVMNNDGLTVNDGAGNVTTTNATGTRVVDGAGNSATTTAAGTIVSNAAGDTTTLGAGAISVADAAGTTRIGGDQIVVGGVSPITLNGATGTIGGLTNKTFDPDNFTSGQAATEDQLKLVSDVANAGWTATDAAGNSANIGPDGKVTFDGDSNISVAQTGVDQEGVIAVSLNENIDLGVAGSVTTGNTVMNNDGLTVDNGVGDSTVVGAGAIAVADSNGTTAINGNEIIIGGLSPIVISGSTGTIEGLTNTTVNYPGFGTAGRAATEEQLKPVTDFIGLNDEGNFNYNGAQYASLQDALDSMHWNVEAPAPDNSGDGSGGTGSGGSDGGSGGNGSDNGSSGGNTPTPIHNGNTVGFVEGDNIVISKAERPDGTGADIKVSVAQDIKVNSVTAKTVNAQEVKIDNGPTINQNGIDMGGKKITNLAAGTESNDAVNLGQLEAATSGLQNQVNQVRGDLSRLDNKLSAGIAAAMATAGLPQAYLPGKSMMSLAGGTYNGESGFAIGVSTVSDNGSWVLKLSGNSNSRGDYGGAVGVGYQW